MKKLKFLSTIFLSCLLLSACSMTSHMVTNNPVGSRVGVAKGHTFQKDLDFSLEKAVQNGDIQKISTVDIHIVSYFFVTKYKTTVTGE